MGIAGVAALAMGLRLTDAQADLPTADMRAQDAARISALQHAAFTNSESQPGLNMAEAFEIQIRARETFEQAIRRAGVTETDAAAAAALVDQAREPIKAVPGVTFTADIARPIDPDAELRLVGVSMRTGPASQMSISRAYDGSLRLRQMSEPITEETTVVQGEIGSSLKRTAGDMGATSAIVSQAIKLFSHKLDFSRDISDGDTFKLVFNRKITASGRTVEGLELLYAEVNASSEGGKPIRFYRYEGPDGKPEFFDENGKNMRGFLLATPMAVARVTSSFGMRRHPVLGYNKMHQGIDFGGATGTPIYAAGDGVVVEAGRNGGYGNWVKIKHSEGWETGYAHMSKFAPAAKRGGRVKQGQLIGYVGASGRVTGPHLHYEIMRNGAKVNPKTVKIPSGVVLAGAQLAEFKAQRTTMDSTLANAQQAGPTRLAAQEAAPPKAVTLAMRPAVEAPK